MENTFKVKYEIVLDTLKMLIGYWDLAPGLLDLLESGIADEEMIDSFIEIFKKSLDEIKDTEKRDKIISSLEILNRLREKEAKEKKSENENIDSILTDFIL